MIESVGPLTFNQVMGVALGGTLAAAYPMIESAISSGFKIDPSLLQPAPQQPVAPAQAPPASEPKPAPATPAPAPEKPATPAPAPPQL